MTTGSNSYRAVVWFLVMEQFFFVYKVYCSIGRFCQYCYHNLHFEYLLCARHCANMMIYMTIFNFHSRPMRNIPFLSPLYRSRSYRLWRLSNLLEITKFVVVELEIWIQAVSLQFLYPYWLFYTVFFVCALEIYLLFRVFGSLLHFLAGGEGDRGG